MFKTECISLLSCGFQFQLWLASMLLLCWWIFSVSAFTVRYDDDLTCAWKLTENCQFNLAHSSSMNTDICCCLSIWDVFSLQPLPPRSYKHTVQQPSALQTRESSSEDSSSGSRSPVLPPRYCTAAVVFWLEFSLDCVYCVELDLISFG